MHLETFYQLMHRQHYPDLKSFVEEYYRREDSANNNVSKFPSNADIAPDDEFSYADLKNMWSQREKENTKKKNFSPTKNLPTKNSVSAKKGNVRRLPKAFLDFLADPENDFVTVTSTIDTRPTSKDGSTTKMTIKLQDGHVIESVIMRHVSEGGSRVTLCVSSQVGCAMGCTFCATGTMGIRGNLCSGEILEQLVHAGRVLAEKLTAEELDENKESDVIVSSDGSKQKKSEQSLAFVRNIVFMGMGEPLNNYDNVLEACRGMIDRRRWNLAHGRVTVSTVGVTPNMRRLTNDLPEVNLALSLHAPNQPMREAIVPTAKMYPIQDMIEALDEHMMALAKAKSPDGTFGADERETAGKRKRAMIEYVMLKGDTSTIECAHQLGKLCENRHLVVNLIPYNQTDVKDKLSCPSEEQMKEFQRIVTSYGTFCTIRRTMGADIAGACGQLVVAKEQDSWSADVADTEYGPFKNKPNKSKTTAKSKSIKQKPQRLVSPNRDDNLADDENSNNDGDIDKWIKPLAVGTALSASLVALAIGMMAVQRRRK